MILIISSENDTMADEICILLSYSNKEFVRLNENQHITKVFFDFINEIFIISINNIEYNLNVFKTVYYRNGGIFYEVPKIEIDNNLVEFYNLELKSIIGFICYYLKISGANIYGNLIYKEVNKLEILFLAKSLGLKVPPTYILSSLKDFTKIDFSEKYITKSSEPAEAEKQHS